MTQKTVPYRFCPPLVTVTYFTVYYYRDKSAPEDGAEAEAGGFLQESRRHEAHQL